MSLVWGVVDGKCTVTVELQYEFSIAGDHYADSVTWRKTYDSPPDCQLDGESLEFVSETRSEWACDFSASTCVVTAL